MRGLNQKNIKNLVSFLVLVVIFLFSANIVLAQDEQDEIKPNIQVTIGSFTAEDLEGKNCGAGETCPIDWISRYVAAIYRYGVGLAAGLAVLMIMAGGFLWLTSGGSPDRVGKAKEFTTSALSGLLLALFSFMILYTVNPRLTTLDATNIFSPAPPTDTGSEEIITKGCCFIRSTFAQRPTDCRDILLSNQQDNYEACLALRGESEDVLVSAQLSAQSCSEIFGCDQYVRPAEGKGEGEPCSRSRPEECASNICWSGGLFGSAVCIEANSLPNNIVCDEDIQCASGFCHKTLIVNSCRDR